MQSDSIQTYQNTRSSSCRIDRSPDVKIIEGNSQILKFGAIINQLLPQRSKNQTASSVQWREEKSKLLNILTYGSEEGVQTKHRLDHVSKTLNTLMEKLNKQPQVEQRLSIHRVKRGSAPNGRREGSKFRDIQDILEFTEQRVKLSRLRMLTCSSQAEPKIMESQYSSYMTNDPISHKWRQEKEQLLKILSFSNKKPNQRSSHSYNQSQEEIRLNSQNKNYQNYYALKGIKEDQLPQIKNYQFERNLDKIVFNKEEIKQYSSQKKIYRQESAEKVRSSIEKYLVNDIPQSKSWNVSGFDFQDNIRYPKTQLLTLTDISNQESLTRKDDLKESPIYEEKKFPKVVALETVQSDFFSCRDKPVAQQVDEIDFSDKVQIEILRSSKIQKSCNTLYRRLNVLRKLVLVKAFFQMKESLGAQKRQHCRVQAIRKLFGILKGQVNTSYICFIALIANYHKPYFKESSNNEINFSIDELSRIQKPLTRNDSETIMSSSLFPKTHNHNKPSFKQGEDIFNLVSDQSQTLFEEFYKQEIQKIQYSQLHSYAISNPSPREGLTYNIQPYEFYGKDKQQVVEQKSKEVQTQVEEVKIESERKKSIYMQQPTTPPKQTFKKSSKQDIMEIVQRQQCAAKMEPDVNRHHTKNLESPRHRNSQQDLEDLICDQSPIAEPKELPFDQQPASMKKKEMIVKSFTQFLESRRSKNSIKDVTPVKHQYNLSDAETLVMSNQHQRIYDPMNSTHQNGIKESACSKHFTQQKSKIGKKFKEMTRQSTGKIDVSQKENTQLEKKKLNFEEYAKQHRQQGHLLINNQQ